MSDPNVYYGKPEVAIVNVVSAFGVDNTGATDAGPLLAKAFAALLLAGQIAWLPSGTYKVTTAAPPAVAQTVWTGGNVTFTGANAATVANVTFVVSAAPGSPAYCPAWYAMTDIGWDPVSGSDQNAGTVASPVQHAYEIVRRYGGDAPTFNYGQNVAIHLLSSQSANVDPVFFTPKISGGGFAALIGTLTTVHAAFVAGVVTPKVQGTPGTLLQVATMPVGTAAGQLVFNATRGSYASIDKMTGSTATMQQPIPTASVTTIGEPVVAVDNTWATGDTLTTYTVPNCNLKLWAPHAIDVTSGSVYSVSWLQWINIVDTSTTGASVFSVSGGTVCNVRSFCTIPTTLDMSNIGGQQYIANYFVGCYVTGPTVQIWGGQTYFLGGGFTGTIFVYGGSVYFDGDTILRGSLIGISGSVIELSLYSVGLIGIGSSMSLQGPSPLWGLYSLEASVGGSITNNSGQTWVAILKTTTASLLLGSSGGNGSYYNPLSGQWVGNIPLTQANLDIYGGLTDPLLGARFCMATGGTEKSLVRVTFAGGGGTVATPYTAKPGDTVVVSAAGGNIVINIPTLASDQGVIVAQDANTAYAGNTITINGVGANLAKPVPNNGTFAASIVYGPGAGDVGLSYRWFNGGSAGGYLIQ